MGSSSCRDLPYEIPFEIAGKLEGARRVLLQVPPGLRHLSDMIAECLAQYLRGSEIIVQLDPVFGACDLWYPVAEKVLGADAIIHVGHTPYPEDISGPPVSPMRGVRILFLPAHSRLEPARVLIESAGRLLENVGARRVGLVSTAQHSRYLEGVASVLRELGFEPVVPGGVSPYFMDGQVLGCDYRLARSLRDIDGYLYVGGGRFHPLGLYLATQKPVVVADPYRGEAYDLTPLGEKTLRLRLYKVSQAMDAKRIAIVLGLKTGQYRPWLVSQLRELARRRHVETLLYASDRTSIEDLRSLPRVDAIVITSCPRLPIDDFSRFEIPVLTPGEARMALTGMLEPYLFPW